MTSPDDNGADDPAAGDGHGQVEQFATDGPEPRGEHRDESDGFLFGYQTSPTRTSFARPRTTREGITSAVSGPPSALAADWQRYYHEFALTRAPLKLFDDVVIEPGYSIHAERDGDTDEEMEAALRTWASQCVIHAGELGHDLLHLLGQLPSLRRGQGTVLVEKVGTRENPDAIAALMLLDPSTFRFYKREDQNLLIQPDDPVDTEHPRTPDDDAAAYVQYDDELPAFSKKEPIPFAEDELIKFVYDPPVGGAWGTSIFRAIDDRIDALRNKLSDRDTAIRQAGHPWRVISSDTWSEEEAKEFAKGHREGEFSAWEGAIPDPDAEQTFAGRVDFASHAIQIQTHSGEVADIGDAVMDDVQQIFSVMPTSRFKIAYEEDINQFVVEPQQEKDDRLVDKERRYLERKLEPLLAAKADELAGGEYDGDVEFLIQQPESENPLEREDFDAEAFKTVLDAFSRFAQAGGEAAYGRDLPAHLGNIDAENLTPGDDDALQVPVDEGDVEAQAAAADMGIGTGGVADGGDTESADADD